MTPQCGIGRNVFFVPSQLPRQSHRMCGEACCGNGNECRNPRMHDQGRRMRFISPSNHAAILHCARKWSIDKFCVVAREQFTKK